MEENKEIENKEQLLKKEAKKAEPKKERRSIKEIFGEFKGEFLKIIWPSKEDLAKRTFTVIVTSLMIGAIIAGMDIIFANAYKLFVGLFS